MQYIDWTPQLTIDQPVYLDANVLVGTIVNTHQLYPTCVKLTAELLICKCNLLISPISFEECLWATAKLSYCQINNQPSSTFWKKTTYLKHCDSIFKSHKGWITAVSSMVKDWKNAGAPIELVPKTDRLWGNVLDLVPDYMQQFKLTPADAIHLALAKTHARTFITADSDFNFIRNNPPTGDLVILHLS